MIPFSNKKYNIIYADPPWRYTFSKSNSRLIENQYQTMSTDDICNLPIKSITAQNAVLYMWATAPKLLEAIRVINAWGFNYKTHGIWDKEIIGMGYWFRGQHELLTVSTKGNFSPPPSTMRISSIMKEKRTRHSKKPDFIRDLIKNWFPDSECIELFARQPTKGWDTWGNEL